MHPDDDDVLNDDVLNDDVLNDDVVPCPTCWLLADLIPPAPYEDFHRSRCARGHENTLVPSVLAYLLEMLGPAFKRSA